MHRLKSHFALSRQVNSLSKHSSSLQFHCPHGSIFTEVATFFPNGSRGPYQIEVKSIPLWLPYYSGPPSSYTDVVRTNARPPSGQDSIWRVVFPYKAPRVLKHPINARQCRTSRSQLPPHWSLWTPFPLQRQQSGAPRHGTIAHRVTRGGEISAVTQQVESNLFFSHTQRKIARLCFRSIAHSRFDRGNEE